MDTVCLRVTVPVSSFRKPYSREFLESERFPPPATVYGFLLSLVGEENRYTYQNTTIAIAIVNKPQVSTVLRTAWRVKSKKDGVGLGTNRRPDYQEILTGLEFYVWLVDAVLGPRVEAAIEDPSSVSRYGGLSLGESRDLVNDIELSPYLDGKVGTWLKRDESGKIPFPVWVDHVGSKSTRWAQFNLIDEVLETPGPEDSRWIKIEPNQKSGKK